MLLYEGIVSQIFDYDYVWSLESFQANRVYLNITQEGKDDIDDPARAAILRHRPGHQASMINAWHTPPSVAFVINYKT